MNFKFKNVFEEEFVLIKPYNEDYIYLENILGSGFSTIIQWKTKTLFKGISLNKESTWSKYWWWDSRSLFEEEVFSYDFHWRWDLNEFPWFINSFQKNFNFIKLLEEGIILIQPFTAKLIHLKGCSWLTIFFDLIVQ